MTKEYFKGYKAQLTQMMNSYLEHSHTVGYPLKDYCVAYSTETISIKAGEEEEEARYLLTKVQDLMEKPNTVMSMHGYTKQSGRYDFFSYIEYRFTTTIVKAEIEAHQVEEAMKAYVKKQLGIKNHEYLECKVMQLFKDGSIEWEQVIEAHQGECSL